MTHRLEISGQGYLEELIVFLVLLLMNQFLIRQFFELKKFISTTGRQYGKISELGCEISSQNIVKCGKYSIVKFANFVYACMTCEK